MPFLFKVYNAPPEPQIFYFNSYGSGNFNQPQRMVDNDDNTFGSGGSYLSETQILNGNTCDGTNLGTITKVEMRVLEYSDSSYLGYFQMRPLFDGSNYGSYIDILQKFQPKHWTSWYDITNDTNAPGSWTWTDVQNLDVRFYSAPSEYWPYPNLASVYTVQIRVTYTN